MKVASSVTFGSVRQWLQGPLLTIAMIAVVELLTRTVLRIPNPAVPLLLTVVYAAYAGGTGPGLASAAVTLGYAAVAFSRPEGVFVFGTEEMARVAVVAITATTMALLVGVLRERLQRAAETLLHQERALSRGLLASLQDGLVVSDADGRITDVNPRFAEMTGFSREELIGRTPPYPFWGSDDLRITTSLQRALSGERNEIDAEFVRRDGTPLTAIVARAPLQPEDGAGAGVVSTYKDITERQAVAARLSESEERHRVITESINDSIVTVDGGCRIMLVNPATERMFGWPAAELIGKPLTVLMPEDLRPGHTGGFERYVRTGKRTINWDGIVVRGLKRDGTEFPLEISFGEMKRGGEVQFSGVMRDITERTRSEEALRQTEEQLRQAQKMEAVGQLAGGIAHDFNNLLTAISGYTDLLLDRLSDDDTARADALEIRRAAERAAALTGQLLAFSRRQVMQPRPIELNAVVRGVEPMLRRLVGEDVRVRTTLADVPLAVMADPGQIEQVVLNLVVNARDAMPEGGVLSIETYEAEIEEAMAPGHIGASPGRHAVLAVSDTGVGFDEETKARLFEPFFTTKERGKGTGLGLSTVYGIVTQSGGTVWPYSEPGQGASFKVYLPLLEQQVVPAPAAAPQPARGRGTETVLLAEDEAAVRGLARHILRREGYTVLEAASGDDALVLASQHEGPIDLLVTDVVMPGISGVELARRVSEQRPGLRVLYTSGYTDNVIIQRGVLAPGVDFLQKPFNLEALARHVRAVLDGPGTEPGAILHEDADDQSDRRPASVTPAAESQVR